MGMCYVPDCDHTLKHGCSMFRFPTDIQLKQKWEKLIRRSDAQPTKFSVVCSCHFVENKKENLPTLFNRNKDKRFSFPSPETKKRRKISSLSSPIVPCSSDLSYMEAGPSTSTHASPKNISSTASQVAEIYFLKKEIEVLNSKLQNLQFSYDHIANDDNLISMYTGLPTCQMFDVLVNYLTSIEINYYSGWIVSKMNKRDQILMTLMKLRLNSLHGDLAVRFNCSKATVSNVVLTWIHVMHEALYKKLLLNKVPTANKNKTCLPSAFSNFTNCRMVIDCTEVKTVTPSQLDKQKKTYSTYKHQNTLKGLVGVAPNGAITFLSDLYVGNTSDKKIVETSGILSIFEPGDLILADKGFLIQDILPAGVSLNIPPFLVNAQFTPEEIRQTTAIAKARIHVERAIQRIKKFKILKEIPATLRPFSSKVFQVCGVLANFTNPLIKEVEDLFD